MELGSVLDEKLKRLNEDYNNTFGLNDVVVDNRTGAKYGSNRIMDLIIMYQTAASS